MEEFRVIVARRGQWKSDIQEFVRTAMEAGIPEQLTLGERAAVEAVEALRPPAGSGITSVTVSAGGKSATLTQKPH